eukprot:scaffold14803_cov27-Tisochrysis_lutea.AAC.1
MRAFLALFLTRSCARNVAEGSARAQLMDPQFCPHSPREDEHRQPRGALYPCMFSSLISVVYSPPRAVTVARFEAGVTACFRTSPCPVRLASGVHREHMCKMHPMLVLKTSVAKTFNMCSHFR